MRRWILGGVAALLGIALTVVGVLSYRYRPKEEREDPATVAREIQALTLQRDSLRALVYEITASSDLLDGRPPGDIVIGLPTPFVDAVVREVVPGWFHDVDLRLPPMRLRKSGEVKARLGLFGRRSVGVYDLEVNLRAVRGRLQPGVPVMRFGGDIIQIDVPVRVAGGTGIARVKIDWESKGIAGPVCGDLSADRDVTGQVRPQQYVARGRIRLSAERGRLVADPAFPGLAIRLFVDPARNSFAALDSILAKKGGMCGFAVGKARASERIQELVARGFIVRIPQRFFRPIQLPIAFETAVPIQNLSFALQVVPSGLKVTPSTLWMAAAVSVAPHDKVQHP